MAPSLNPVVARDGSVVEVGEIGVAMVENREKTVSSLLQELLSLRI